MNGGAYTKGQIYGASLPAYRLRAPKKKQRNNSCCMCCLCLIVLLLILFLLAGIAGLVFWVIYRPQLPKISVNSVQIPKFKVTGISHLTYEFIVKLNAMNPNKKVSFIYDDFPVKLSSDGVDIAEGSVPGFFHGTQNNTVVKADLKSPNMVLDGSDAKKLKSAESKGKITLDIKVGTRVRVQIGKWKSPKIGIEVNCSEISAEISRTKKTLGSTTSDSNSKCNFKVRVKVFKWYF